MAHTPVGLGFHESTAYGVVTQWGVYENPRATPLFRKLCHKFSRLVIQLLFSFHKKTLIS